LDLAAARERQRQRQEHIARKAALLRGLSGERTKVARSDRRTFGIRAGQLFGRLKASRSATVGEIMQKALGKKAQVRDRQRFVYRETHPDAPLHARFCEWQRLSDALASALGEDRDEMLLRFVEGTRFAEASSSHTQPFVRLYELFLELEQTILARYDFDAAFEYLDANQLLIEPGPSFVNPQGACPRFSKTGFVADAWVAVFFAIEPGWAGDKPTLEPGRPLTLSDFLPGIPLADRLYGEVPIDRELVNASPWLQHWYYTSKEAAGRPNILLMSRISLAVLPVGADQRARLCLVQEPYMEAVDERGSSSALNSPLDSDEASVAHAAISRVALRSAKLMDDRDTVLLEQDGWGAGHLLLQTLSGASIADVFGRPISNPDNWSDSYVPGVYYWDDAVCLDGELAGDHSDLPAASPHYTFAASIERNLAFAEQYEPERRIDRLLEAGITKWIEAVEAHRSARLDGFEAAISEVLEQWRASAQSHRGAAGEEEA
jgi:hypothetical protein